MCANVHNNYCVCNIAYNYCTQCISNIYCIYCILMYTNVQLIVHNCLF